jgi:hypothetical protein
VLNTGKRIEIHDWSMAVPTHLSETWLDDSPDLDPRMKARKMRWRDRIASRNPSSVPGDYIAQRIFCALGSAAWRDFHQEHSALWDPALKQRITLREWMSSSENASSGYEIMALIRDWAQGQEDGDIATLGIRYRLAPPGGE